MNSAADETRYQKALKRFEDENARDPNVVVVDGVRQPREVAHARWLLGWVLKLSPNASEALRLAAGSQHICRWTLPRDSYPMTRSGYLQWRENLKKFHAKKAREILREIGYPEEVVARVQSLNLKKGFPNDAECRVLEDTLCLVFLEHQLGELAAKTSDDKVVNALKKSWQKMTPLAREVAKGLAYSPREKALLDQALS